MALVAHGSLPFRPQRQHHAAQSRQAARQARPSAWAAAATSGQRRQRRQRQPLVLVRADSDGGEPNEGKLGPLLRDLALPKFRPFVPQNAVQQAMLRYRVRVPARGAEGSTLLVAPLTKDWIPAAAEVLTDSFAVSLGAAPYTNFLRRQVKSYLELHCELPPKAVVLVALLLPPELAAAEVALAGGGAGGAAALSSWQQSDSDLEMEMGDGMAMIPLLGGSPPSSSSQGSLGSSGSSDGGEQEEAEQQQQPGQPQQGQQLPAAGQQQGAAPPASLVGPGSGAELVGVVELSFSASTRSKYLTLNPPADRPYLCNMATHPAHRGRGYGYALLKAAEALVVQLGELEVYLHLRVQDEPAAKLYSKAGYEKQAEDSIFVRFMGLDQRRLMRKRLPKPPPAGAAPAAESPSTAAEAAAAPPPAQRPTAVPPKMRLQDW